MAGRFMTSEKRDEWEYKVVYTRLVLVGGIGFSEGHLSQAVLQMDAELNSLGTQGWELVFVQHLQKVVSTEYLAYIFKRPKLDTAPQSAMNPHPRPSDLLSK
jgi:hypothetical protein